METTKPAVAKQAIINSGGTGPGARMRGQRHERGRRSKTEGAVTVNRGVWRRRHPRVSAAPTCRGLMQIAHLFCRFGRGTVAVLQR